MTMKANCRCFWQAFHKEGDTRKSFVMMSDISLVEHPLVKPTSSHRGGTFFLES